MALGMLLVLAGFASEGPAMPIAVALGVLLGLGGALFVPARMYPTRGEHVGSIRS